MTGIAFTPQTMKSTLNLLGGPALPTQFMTFIVPPAGMLGSPEFTTLSGLISALPAAFSIAGSMALSVMTEKTVIPGKGFQTSDIVMHGKMLRLPRSLSHDTIRMTFICSNSMIERTYFDMWTQFIQKPDTHYMEYFDQFKTTIIIKKLSGSGLIDGLLADPTGKVSPELRREGAPNPQGGYVDDGGNSGPTPNNPLVEIGSALSTYYLQEAYPLRIGAQELSSADTQGYLTLDVEFAFTHYKCILDNLVPWMFGGPQVPESYTYYEPGGIPGTELPTTPF